MLTSLTAAILAAAPCLADDPERRAPDAGAPAHTAFAWTSEEGLRYTWVLPDGYDPAEPRNLTVICHGTGLDYRWGAWNNKPGIFRPDDIVVSVDGPSPNGESRLFLGEPKDAEAVRDFLREMRAAFAVDRVFLYGHSQGGFFVVYFAGEHPDEVAGVVAHASGAWNGSKTGKGVRKVAIAFMHGTADPVVPYRQSPGSRDAYVDAKLPLVSLRRLERYNHWPNAVRANECLAWCDGMTTDDPAAALASAREILRPKGRDEYQWETAVGFSQARAVLRRLQGEGPAALKDVPQEIAAAAQRAADAIEAEGERHVAALRGAVEKGFKAGAGPWLGHLVALREDFRGVDAVEAFVKELGFDKQLASHGKAAGKLLDAWYSNLAADDKFARIVDALEDGFLFEGYPPELAEQVQAWVDNAERFELDRKSLAKVPAFEAWRDGWKTGAERYKALWSEWRGAPE